MKRTLLLYRSLRLRYSEFEIPAEAGGAPIQGVYIGEGLSLPYFLTLYQAVARRQRATAIPIWRLGRLTVEAMARFPVVLVEINAMLGFLLPDGGWIADPWIRHETDLQGERYRHRRRGIEGTYGRRVRKHAFQCRVSRDPGDLERFYREYYVPYIKQRHGENAFVRPLIELRRAARSGFLLQVWQGAAWVSGLVASPASQQRLKVLAVGLDPLYPEGRRQCALPAAYYHLFRWAREGGFRIVDLGGTRPHLMDGVFKHKTLWGAEPKRDRWHHTEITFYVDPTRQLPKTVTQQLVITGNGFAALGERLGGCRGN